MGVGPYQQAQSPTTRHISGFAPLGWLVGVWRAFVAIINGFLTFFLCVWEVFCLLLQLLTPIWFGGWVGEAAAIGTEGLNVFPQLCYFVCRERS